MLSLLFLFLGLMMMFFKRGGVLSWLFTLEVFGLSLIFLFLGSSMSFIFSLVIAVCSACVLITFLVSILVGGSSVNFWSFNF